MDLQGAITVLLMGECNEGENWVLKADREKRQGASCLCLENALMRFLGKSSLAVAWLWPGIITSEMGGSKKRAA